MARGNGARGSFWGLSASLAAAILNLSGKSFPSHTDFAPWFRKTPGNIHTYLFTGLWAYDFPALTDPFNPHPLLPPTNMVTSCFPKLVWSHAGWRKDIPCARGQCPSSSLVQCVEGCRAVNNERNCSRIQWWQLSPKSTMIRRCFVQPLYYKILNSNIIRWLWVTLIWSWHQQCILTTPKRIIRRAVFIGGWIDNAVSWVNGSREPQRQEDLYCFNKIGLKRHDLVDNNIITNLISQEKMKWTRNGMVHWILMKKKRWLLDLKKKKKW